MATCMCSSSPRTQLSQKEAAQYQPRSGLTTNPFPTSTTNSCWMAVLEGGGPTESSERFCPSSEIASGGSGSDDCLVKPNYGFLLCFRLPYWVVAPRHGYRPSRWLPTPVVGYYFSSGVHCRTQRNFPNHPTQVEYQFTHVKPPSRVLRPGETCPIGHVMVQRGVASRKLLVLRPLARKQKRAMCPAWTRSTSCTVLCRIILRLRRPARHPIWPIDGVRFHHALMPVIFRVFSPAISANCVNFVLPVIDNTILN